MSSSPVPAIVLAPPASAKKMSPEEFFGSLRVAHAAARRAPPSGGKPQRKSRALRQAPSSPRLFGAPPPPVVKKCSPHFDLHRSDGKRLRLTHATLVCFFDLTVEQACQALLTNAAVVKRLRCWYGTNCWPRCQVVGGTHPTFTLADIRVHRNSVMKWAFDNGEEVLYDSLARATRLLSVDSLVPLDADLLDALDGLFSEEPDSSDPVTDFPFSLPPQLMPQPPQEVDHHDASASSAECVPEPADGAEASSLPPGLFHWDERDEDEDFFNDMLRRGDSRNPFE
jgi:hypothetical protein